MIDGDTFDMRLDGKQVRVRMYGIDAPERKQAYYRKSKETLSDLIYGRKIRIEKRDTDRYKRIVADVYLDEEWINLKMIQRGMAWHFTRYSSNATLARAEHDARASRKGLWSQQAVAPWNYRSASRNGVAR